MNWVDLVIVVSVAFALWTGYRRGALLQVFSWGGFLAGIVVGITQAPRLVNLFSPKSAGTRALISLGAWLGIAFVVEAIIAAVGIALRRKIKNHSAASADKIVGCVVGGALALFIAWLLGVTLARGPSQEVARQVRGSAVLRAMDQVLPRPPALLAEIGRFLNQSGFPDVFAQLNPSLAPGVAPAPASLARDPEIMAAAAATYKIESSGCGGVVDGSGFPVGNGMLITAAHVVAGTSNTRVISPEGARYPGTVVYVDFDVDIAVIRVVVPGRALSVDRAVAPRGTDGAAIGYPGGKARTTTPARVRAETNAMGRDIYSRKLVSRPIYVLAAHVIQGNSGGPFVDDDGRVRGMIFAASASNPNESYALVGDVIVRAMTAAGGRTRQADTGACAL